MASANHLSKCDLITNVVGFSKAAAKLSGREGDRGGGLIHLPLAGEVNSHGGLLVEAEDLDGG